MSSLSEVRNGLRSEWSALESQWRLTRSQWRDGVANSFEKESWHELEEGIPQFLRELEHVDEVLDQALRSVNR